MMNTKPQYVIRFFFDAGSATCFWPVNDDARKRFGSYIQPEDLPLSKATIKCADDIVDWQTASLNWNYPPDPGPWRQDECDHFNQAVKELLEEIYKELADHFEIINEFKEINEDPDLSLGIFMCKSDSENRFLQFALEGMLAIMRKVLNHLLGNGASTALLLSSSPQNTLCINP
ncbi:hypothetical protein KDW_39870 [Dictyobacter vulcani]|uniref:Uncharacterized protein n=1 Tax=Dictyobacter vulcani TaxID=2607529 RepID=A0A5J4KPM4_9CHLR|nr:hypothetical protein [Dictyobacter vulcani]GER89825.1 hypothetical protein KDW_39870 [Dictyobacter vulcani]